MLLHVVFFSFHVDLVEIYVSSFCSCVRALSRPQLWAKISEVVNSLSWWLELLQPSGEESTHGTRATLLECSQRPCKKFYHCVTDRTLSGGH